MLPFLSRLLVPDLQRLAADGVQNGEESGLVGVFEPVRQVSRRLKTSQEPLGLPTCCQESAT